MIYHSFYRSLRKSTSIPVHLTVSTNNEVVLPPGLRPHSTCHLEHEPDCAALKQNISEKWSSAQSLPTQIGTRNRRGPGTPCGTPTGETLSSLQKKKFVKWVILTPIIFRNYLRRPLQKHVVVTDDGGMVDVHFPELMRQFVHFKVDLKSVLNL